jgi:hypothetical protein
MFNDGQGATQELDALVLQAYLVANPVQDPKSKPLNRITKLPLAAPRGGRGSPRPPVFPLFPRSFGDRGAARYGRFGGSARAETWGVLRTPLAEPGPNNRERDKTE